MSPETGTEAAAVRVFLRRFAQALTPLPADMRRELVEELRSHLCERAEGGATALDAALRALGDPIAYARRFIEDAELAGALHRAAPASLLMALLTRASRNLLAAGAVTLALIAYVFAFAFAGVAVLKPFFPTQVGLWTGPDVLMLGFLSAPPADVAERLGVWIIPLGVVAAVLAYGAATRMLRWTGGRLLHAAALAAER